MKASYISVISILLSLTITGCGGFESQEQSNQSSVGSPRPIVLPPVVDDGESVPDGVPEPTPTQIAGPTHVPRGKCSGPIRIQVLSAPNGPQVITVPDNLKDKLFLDQHCSGPSLRTSRLRTNRLPLQIFFRSPVLSENTLTLNVNGAQSNSLEILSYKEQFANVSLASGAVALQVNNNHNLNAKFFRLQGDTPNISTPTNPVFVERNLTPALVPDTATVLSSQSGTRHFVFNKTHVYYDGQRIAARATAIVEPSANVGFAQACYSTAAEIFCANTSGSAPYSFIKVALPAGDISDLSSRALGLVCAVAGGRVYCWKNDFVPFEMVDLGTSNVAVAVTNGEILSGNTLTTAQIVNRSQICSLTAGRVFCSNNGAVRGLEYVGITRITAGPEELFLVIEGEVMGIKFGEIRSTLSNFRQYLPYNTYFDEIYALRFLRTINDGDFLGGCARVEAKLVCFENIRENTVIDFLEIEGGFGLASE